MAIRETNSEPSGIAIKGTATGEKGVGVYGEGKASGVRGNGETWHGVAGLSKSTTGGNGVYGKNTAGGTGVRGESDEWVGVYGESKGSKGGAAGVMGEHKADGAGVIGKSLGGIAVFGISENHEGVHAETKSTRTAAMAAYQMNQGSPTAALYAKHAGSGLAAVFEGNVDITGTLTFAGVNIIQALFLRIQQLEQEVANLKKGTSTGTGSTTASPVIKAEVELNPKGRYLSVTGGGFQAGEGVKLTINYFPGPRENASTSNYETPADRNGFINFGFLVTCPNDMRPKWEVQATGLSSRRESNLASASC